jgi:hypothetical protein
MPIDNSKVGYNAVVTDADDRREKRRAYDREYRARNREKIRERNREYQEHNRERLRESKADYMRDYNVRNREKNRAYQREYYARSRVRRRAEYEVNREERLAYAREHRREYNRRLKSEVFAAYGNCCACCGEDNPAFLSIDHVNGGGRAHRKAVGGGIAVLLDIIKRGFPAHFQLLCYNCNLGRYFNGGTCPHKDQDDFQAA